MFKEVLWERPAIVFNIYKNIAELNEGVGGWDQDNFPGKQSDTASELLRIQRDRDGTISVSS